MPVQVMGEEIEHHKELSACLMACYMCLFLKYFLCLLVFDLQIFLDVEVAILECNK